MFSVGTKLAFILVSSYNIFYILINFAPVSTHSSNTCTDEANRSPKLFIVMNFALVSSHPIHVQMRLTGVQSYLL